MIDSDIRHIVERELVSGEKLLWAGRPMKMPLPWLAIGYLIFIIIWFIGFLNMFFFGGFSEFFTEEPFSVSALPFLLIPAFILCVGLAILWGTARLIRRPAKQIYGLTQNRGLIIENKGKGPVHSIRPAELASLTRKGGSDIGTLEFRSPNLMQFQFNLSNF